MSNGYPSDWDSKRRKVYRRDNYTCQNCGAKVGPSGNNELHAHHIVPKSKGGTHQPNNLITLCNNCHDAIHGNGYAPTASNPYNTKINSDSRSRIDKKFGGCICCGRTNVLEKNIDDVLERGLEDGEVFVKCTYCKALYQRNQIKWVSHYKLVEGDSELVGKELRPKEWKYLNKYPGKLKGIEKEVHRRLKENLDGESFHQEYLKDLSYLEIVGIAEPGEFATTEANEKYDRESMNGTLLDPDNDIWNSYNVETYFDVTKKIDTIIEKLRDEGIIYATRDGRNSKIIHVRSLENKSKKEIAEEMENIPVEQKAAWSKKPLRLLGGIGFLWAGGFALLLILASLFGGDPNSDSAVLFLAPGYLLITPFIYFWYKDHKSPPKYEEMNK